MGKKEFNYTGIQVLEAVSYARNYNQSLLDIIKKETTKIKKPFIVDFGAGEAMYASMLRDQLNIDPVCIELDKKLREMAKKDGFKTAASIQEISKKADIVYSLNVFEHIENDEAIAKEIYDNIKSGGTLIVYVPAFQILYSSMDKLVEHYRRYRLKRLRNILESVGFDIIKIEYADPLGFFAAALFKIFGNKNGYISPFGVKVFDRFIYPVSKLIQPLTAKLFGKNVYAVAIKRG